MYDGSSSFIDLTNPRGFQVSINNESPWEPWRGTVTAVPPFDQGISHQTTRVAPMPIKDTVSPGAVLRSTVIVVV